MARHESQREDLLAEATALVERVEIIARAVHRNSEGGDSSTPVVAGFRASGALSLFFGEDPVYQFNAEGELRRAFVSGRLYKAVGGQLIELTRIRQSQQVVLRRHELTAKELTDFLSQMIRRLRGLQALLDSNTYQVVGQVPPDVDVVGRVRNWLAQTNLQSIAKRPNA
jgi:hypothetical protein